MQIILVQIYHQVLIKIWAKKSGFFATVKGLAANTIGVISKMVTDFLLPIIDFFQYVANLVQTVRPDNTFKDVKIMYSYEDLEKDGKQTGVDGDGNRNKYTNVTEYGEGEEVFKRKVIKKDRNKNKEDDFTEDTEIPLVIGDLYNIAVDHIDFIDANFFSGSITKKADGTELRHDEDSIWMKFRNVAAVIIRINIYVASSILVISLIWFGFNIVRHTFDNPTAKADAKKGITKVANAIFMLVGTILLMTLCIMGSQALCSKIASQDSYELPIRVDVEDTYSFSTTLTGYLRYMASTEDLEEWLQMLAYTLLYAITVVINLATIILMILRMFFLLILSIIGPILSVLYVFGKKGFMRYGTWLEMYVIISMMQLAFTAIYTLVLNLTF